MEDYLLLIDGSSLLSTQFYGNLPREILYAKTLEEKEKYYYKIMMTSTGVYTNGVFGFLRYLFKILKNQKPAYIAVAWDLSRDTFRRELYGDYKGNRSETMAPLKEQFALCQEVLKNMGVVQLMDARYEADDFCGSAAAKFEKQIPVKILTKDNDYLQLVTDNTSLWLMHSTAEKTEELFVKYGINKDGQNLPDRVFCFTPELVRSEFGVDPCNINSLKGLMGDSSDNIKGVPGVGPATAVRLIAEYKTVEELYRTLDDLDKAGEASLKKLWKERLGITRSPLSALLKESDTELVGRKAAFLSEELATIKKTIPLKLELEDLKTNIDKRAAQAELDRLEFKSLHIDFDIDDESVRQEPQASIHEINTIAEAKSAQEKIIAAKAAGIALAGGRDELFAIAVSAGGKAWYLKKSRLLDESFIELFISELIEKCDCVYSTDAKILLHHLSIEFTPKLKCIAVGAYLLEPLEGSYTPEYISKTYCDRTLKSYQEQFGKVGISEASENEKFKEYLCRQAETAQKAGPIIDAELANKGMDRLYLDIEMPLVYDLCTMEKTGIAVLSRALKEYSDELAGGIDGLRRKICEQAGTEFNILSPKQLGDVLFERLGLPYAKKTKSGYSTAADVLERLKDDYPIVNDVLQYRQLTKLRSTYAEGLAAFISSDGRIHGTFNQTVTATGRISSTEPNLQNIPVRMELGRKIRKVFVPEDGCIFLDADYSQIELRVLAHMSGDESLIKAYRTAQDIHAITASQVFHVPLDEVTAAQRRNAKAVNFGIVYGISAFGLSEDLSITRSEANEYINHYFETFPGVKSFLDKMVSQGREQEYVTTLYGRRRPIPELKSNNFMQRQFGERVAMNSPIQGTAADIMKIAMTRVNRRLKAERLRSRIVLQVHDELLLEVPIEEKEAARRLLAEEMQAAAKLEVPLEVSISEGRTWYETK